MSYTRWNESGHYIWGGESILNFDDVAVEDDAVDVFLYKLYDLRGGDNPRGGDEEFWERYHHGKRVIEAFQKGVRVVKLTRHEPADLKVETAAVAALAGVIWREHFTPIIGAAQVEYMLNKFQTAEQIYTDITKNEYDYFVAKEAKGGEPIGYCAICPKSDHAFLSKLYLLKDYRGRGLARLLLEDVKARCRFSYGAEKIRLTVNKKNTDSIAAYEKMGFVNIDSVKTDIGEGFFMDDYVMEMILSKGAEPC
jgi:ribosomal protein S18 acetylase RimI-like enzyme